jgi:hypothetical protein
MNPKPGSPFPCGDVQVEKPGQGQNGQPQVAQQYDHVLMHPVPLHEGGRLGLRSTCGVWRRAGQVKAWALPTLRGRRAKWKFGACVHGRMGSFLHQTPTCSSSWMQRMYVRARLRTASLLAAASVTATTRGARGPAADPAAVRRVTWPVPSSSASSTTACAPLAGQASRSRGFQRPSGFSGPAGGSAMHERAPPAPG